MKESCTFCGKSVSVARHPLLAVPGNELGDYTHRACFAKKIARMEREMHAELRGHAWAVFDFLEHAARTDQHARQLLADIQK